MEASAQSTSLSGIKFRNPLVLRVGQVMTGFGLGCGLGIGLGVPIPMDLPGVAQVMSAANGMARHVGGGRHLRGLIKRVGIKNLEAGIGCGVGLGHGFGIGLALKPGVAQQILHVLQDSCAIVISKVRPKNNGEAHTETLGDDNSKAHVAALRPCQSELVPSPLSQFASTPSIKASDPEVEGLRTQNEILLALLRHQERIEILENENEVLRKKLNINGFASRTNTRAPGTRISNVEQSSRHCFECRRQSRRRN